MKIEFEGTVEEFIELMSGDNIDTNIAVIQLDKDDYWRFFDESSLLWSGCVERDLMTLRQTQKYAYDVLGCKGYLFLNDVLGMLGLQKTKNGQVVGWTYKEGIKLDAERYVALHQSDGDDQMFIEEHDIYKDEELANVTVYYGIEFYVRDNERQFTDYHIVFRNESFEGYITRTQRRYTSDMISGIIPISCRLTDENIIKKLIYDVVAKFKAEEGVW